MSLYETVIIIRQETSTQQVEALADTFEDIVKQSGGSVKKRENWGLRSLAYKIKKNKKGHYILLNIEAPPTAIHEMERVMRLNEDILRYLTLRIDEIDEGPSIPAQNLARIERSSKGFSSKTEDTENSKPKEDEKKKVETTLVEAEKTEIKVEGEA
ncbi:MAG TPA: 30S ribosomal protein S6 [Rhodospirillales bacterium]|jgi:small subunit ribosomal protein S6|nr:30S ribosomal protein S6 [Rhodospirillales bacterium]HIL74409.1 30S ribosomal protein S6 [Rhodospirillales bacterium]